MKTAIVIHGGAGTITRSALSPEKEQQYRQALQEIITAGQDILTAGGSATDAVTEAVRLLEECPLFNAGKGSVFTHQGTHELDACLMDGRTRQAGAVAAVSRVRNPVLAAKAVLEHSPHVLLAGPGADDFAAAQGLEMVSKDFYSTAERFAQLQQALQSDGILLDHDAAALQGGDPIDPKSKFGTVGAVALDAAGNLASATSTGGLTNKRAGRIGDTPLPGAGCYADQQVAVSCTGTGEVFILAQAGYDISAQIRYAGRSLDSACEHLMRTIGQLDGEGGLIAVDASGHIALPFNSEGMYRASAQGENPPQVAIYRQLSDI
ncbi:MULTISPECIES: isoaspartyl peptidase/L-asparaginase [unclassified Tatumella]|uniref:isoaspartyl peptidase/L-asparaginase family protein n=1 Tax=unclassified Tatumella TaxID=2649542 RepID=UPI001BAFE4FD|nr:isoaspartyl peptidase/L-asparaginase [Tatumella sp. JGM16]MBS0913270.1 isoaspartyl peptidase/L-asparaginase [Tatumella sp. JGM91]